MIGSPHRSWRIGTATFDNWCSITRWKPGASDWWLWASLVPLVNLMNHILTLEDVGNSNPPVTKEELWALDSELRWAFGSCTYQFPLSLFFPHSKSVKEAIFLDSSKLHYCSLKIFFNFIDTQRNHLSFKTKSIRRKKVYDYSKLQVT